MSTHLNRHEAARIASSAIASYAARNTNLSYDGMADAVVTAYVDLAVLSVVDTDDVAAQRREDAEYRALDRDQDEVDRERGAAFQAMHPRDERCFHCATDDEINGHYGESLLPLPVIHWQIPQAACPYRAASIPTLGDALC